MKYYIENGGSYIFDMVLEIKRRIDTRGEPILAIEHLLLARIFSIFLVYST